MPDDKFLAACNDGELHSVEALLPSTSKALTAEGFYWACWSGKYEIVARLLKEEINFNITNGDEGTPFAAACSASSIPQADVGSFVKVLELLLQDKRINVNPRSSDGETPFFTACKFCPIEVFEVLLNNNRIEKNPINRYGETPFQHLCMSLVRPEQYYLSRHLEVFGKLLKDIHIDIDKADNHGWTPFTNACSSKSPEFIKALAIEKFARNSSLATLDTMTFIKQETNVDNAKDFEFSDITDEIIQIIEAAKTSQEIQLRRDELDKMIMESARKFPEHNTGLASPPLKLNFNPS